MQDLCAGYPNLFGVASEEDTEPGDEEGDAGADQGSQDEFTARWGWVRNVDAVSETCRCSWDAVWDMAVTQFLNILSYRNDKIAKETKDLEQWQRTH